MAVSYAKNYLLKKVAQDQAGGSRVVKLKAFARSDESLPPEVNKWLEIANEETLAAHELRCRAAAERPRDL